MGLVVSSSKNMMRSTDPNYARGKNVLITGASAGIGAELARKFAEQGANLALLARRIDKLEAVAKECLSLGANKAQVFRCDLTEDADIQTAIKEAAAALGSFDILVLNAGKSMGCYFEEIGNLESINHLLKLNVNGVINALWCALPAIPKSADSRIVVISSVSGIIGVPYRTVYCASKHALTGFCNALRIELKDTYGATKVPKVQLINFPEVAGTELNSGRMQMCAAKPPVQFETGRKGMMTVQTACRDLMQEIEFGTDEWGQSLKFQIVVLLRLFLAAVADARILKAVKKTHFRPSVANGDDVSDKAKKTQ